MKIGTVIAVCGIAAAVASVAIFSPNAEQILGVGAVIAACASVIIAMIVSGW